MRRRIAVSSALLGLLASLLTLAAPPSAASEPTFTFDGGGWGHGVGMSQYGARARAAAGHTVSEILGFYYPGAVLSQGPATNDVRVSIGLVSSTTTFTPGGSGTASVWVDGRHITNVANGASVRIGRTADGFSVDLGGQRCGGSCQGSVLEVQFTQGQPIRAGINNRRYQFGRFSIRHEGSRLRVVVRGMTYEQYLYGVNEVPTSWPAAALEAQVVAARTYVTARKAGAGARTFDVHDSAVSQVFVGAELLLGPGGDRWRAAVDATRGRILTFNGAPIDAVYSSSHGGHSETNAYVWGGTPLPFLPARADPFDNGSGGNPRHTWSVSYTGSQLGSILQQRFGVTVGTVTRIEVTGPVGASGRLDRATLTFTGTQGELRTTGQRFWALLGDPHKIYSTKFTISNAGGARPALAGNLDAVHVDGTRAVFSGWSVDPTDPSRPNEIAVRVGASTIVTARADRSRPDVDAVFGYGPDHGFVIPVNFATGTHQVCVVARPLSGTGERSLGCRTVVITASNAPVGNLDHVRLVGDRLVVAGWALDWDDLGRRTPIEVSLDGATSRHDADRARPDVAAALGAGPNHGFRVVLDATPGTRRVCVTAIDLSPGTVHSQLGCRTVEVPVPAVHAPIGSLDAVVPGTEAVRILGWAVDPDHPAVPSRVSVTVGGSAAGTFTADAVRNDVHALLGFGPRHGFRLDVPVDPGHHEVCVTALDLPPGTMHTPLGCRTVEMAAPQSASVPPVGSLDAAVGAHRRVTLAGWAFDPDSAASVSVEVTMNGNLVGTFVADRPRADVAANRQVGPNHGFRIELDADGGTHEVCVRVLDVAPGTDHTELGCRTLAVSSAAPVGHLDAVRVVDGAVILEGWAADSDVDGPIPVEVLLDGEWMGRWKTHLMRLDVAAIRGLGPLAGFRLRIPLSPGLQQVCVRALDTAPGSDHVVLGCRSVEG